MLALYTATIFLGALLLFLVQPMAAKSLLPRLGGSPSVWTTAMVFFQAALLLGYLAAHGLARVRVRARQVAAYGVLLAATLALLPAGIPDGSPGGHAPAPWMLGILTAGVAPFFVALATTSPLLQHWFGTSDHRAAADPYFLYAASNAGSLAALLAYPTLVEPRLPLPEQWRLWSAGYAAFLALVASCAVVGTRRGLAAVEPAAARPPIAGSVRGWWLLLAFVPSSLSLAVTQQISTDIAAVPLLWVIPLAIYLLTFVLAFARRTWVSPRASGWLLGAVAVPMALASFLPGLLSPTVAVVLQLAGLFAGAMLCHGRLAAMRPPADRLTEFYLTVSVGGVLGGVFCSLLAPALFDAVAEYPIALALACLLRPAPAPRDRRPLVSAALTAGAVVAVFAAAGMVPLELLPPALAGRAKELRYVVPGLALLAVVRQPIAFAAGIATLLLVGQVEDRRHTLYVERTFFGVSAVMIDPEGRWHSVSHGVTEHGRQATAPDLRGLPTAYYHPSGPIGEVVRAMDGPPRLTRMAVVGLGAGTLAAYGRPGQDIDFFEIDPAVVRIARDPAFFTYLRDGAAATRIVVGDGRLEMAAMPEATYDLVVLDAFSSDAPPVHLLTVEAIRTYLRTLRPHGLLAFNVSSRTVNLLPILAAAARDLGLVCAFRADAATPEETAQGKRPSVWVLLLRPGEAADVIAALRAGGGWSRAEAEDDVHAWTDGFSDILTPMLRR